MNNAATRLNIHAEAGSRSTRFRPMQKYSSVSVSGSQWQALDAFGHEKGLLVYARAEQPQGAKSDYQALAQGAGAPSGILIVQVKS